MAGCGGEWHRRQLGACDEALHASLLEGQAGGNGSWSEEVQGSGVKKKVRRCKKGDSRGWGVRLCTSDRAMQEEGKSLQHLGRQWCLGGLQDFFTVEVTLSEKAKPPLSGSTRPSTG